MQVVRKSFLPSRKPCAQPGKTRWPSSNRRPCKHSQRFPTRLNEVRTTQALVRPGRMAGENPARRGCQSTDSWAWLVALLSPMNQSPGGKASSDETMKIPIINPLPGPCPYAKPRLTKNDNGSSNCQECQKVVHDLRGKSLIFISEFVANNPYSCIKMGGIPKVKKPVRIPCKSAEKGSDHYVVA